MIEGVIYFCASCVYNVTVGRPCTHSRERASAAENRKGVSDRSLRTAWCRGCPSVSERTMCLSHGRMRVIHALPIPSPPAKLCSKLLACLCLLFYIYAGVSVGHFMRARCLFLPTLLRATRRRERRSTCACACPRALGHIVTRFRARMINMYPHEEPRRSTSGYACCRDVSVVIANRRDRRATEN